MSDQEQVLTDEQIESEAQQLAERDLDADPSGQSHIPKKFVGKDINEVFDAYRALESEKGRLASELGQERKEREEQQRRIENLESQMRQPANFQQQPQQPVQQPQYVDPLESFEDEFNEDPARAVSRALRQQELARKAELEQIQQQTKASSASDYYYKQKAENPDFARREQIMAQLLQRYGAHFADHQSKEVLEILDLASQGYDRKYYEQQAASKIQEGKNQVLSEKRQAQSEAPYTEGEQSVNFEDLSLEEMEKLLPKSDNY